MGFKNYLQQKKLSTATIHCYDTIHHQFLGWLEREHIDHQTFGYNELLDFIRHLQQKGNSSKTINLLLGTVRHYCRYLIGQQQRTDNPAAGLQLKGVIRSLPMHLLDIEALEKLYWDYNQLKKATDIRKAILGLWVYQGLKLSELKRLQNHHIRLGEGKILIVATKRTNGRTLHLQAIQIPLLQDLLQQNESNKQNIFIAPGYLADNPIRFLLCQLKKLNEKVIDGQQLRSSVIAFWLRQNNLRQVQYMAGHKYVSSTERYQSNHLEDLQKALQQHHPNK